MRYKYKTSDLILYGESILQVANFKVGVDRHLIRLQYDPLGPLG